MSKLHAYWRWLLLILFILSGLAIIWLNRASTIPATEAASPPLLAFYYGWYDEQTWTSGLVPQQPSFTYRSTDPATIARHVGEARRAGIDGFVMSWYGPQLEFNQTEPNFALLLDEAHRQGFTAAVDFETHSPFFPDRASVVAGLKYLLNTHAQHPAYFRFNGKPVIFFWQQSRFTIEEWQAIRQEADPNHTSLWIAEGVSLSYQFQFDGHHLYNISWASDVSATLTHWRDLVRYFASFYDLERYWVATTMPGFDERHLGRPDRNYRARGTGEFYKESWAAAMATEPDMLIITSFNEWVEDSQIEPGLAYGNYYLDLTYALRTGGSLPATPVLPTATPTLTPSPTSTPGVGSIVGILTDATSGDRLADVSLSAAGQTTASSVTGYYRFDNVVEDIQIVVAQKAGYLTVEQARIVGPGQVVWNSIAMLSGVDPTATATVLVSPTALASPTATPTPSATAIPSATPTPSSTATPIPSTVTPIPQIGILLGIITNVESGQPSADVSVSADGQMVKTNANGLYILDNLPAGTHEVLAQHPKYKPASKSQTVLAGAKRWNSFTMQLLATPTPNYTVTPSPTATLQPTATPTVTPTPQPTNTPAPSETATPPPGSLVGVITHVNTNERVVGAHVSTNGQTVQSNGIGVYYFAALPPGPHQVAVEHPGFLSTTKTGFVVSNQTRWNSIALTSDTASTATVRPQVTATQTPTVTPSATTQPTATPTPALQTGTLIGIITKAGTDQELAEVTVSVADQTMVTNQNGLYRFDDLPAGHYTITAEKEGYETHQIEEIVEAGETQWASMELVPLLGHCPSQSQAEFTLIPLGSSPGDRRPDYLHGDLNFALRGFSRTTASTSLMNYSGGTDVNAPQLAGLFNPAEFSGISSVYRANHWDWGCGEHGCRGGIITEWPVTVIGLTTSPGESLHIPPRGPQIYSGSFKAMVLYAEKSRITLGYTRDDSVAFGYAVHLENICVDAKLLALYQAQNDADGYRSTGFLPALRENEFFATALDTEIQIAIRDRGTFLDPRSRKDWWR